MKTSTGRRAAIATLLTLLLASSVFTVGRTTAPPPTTPRTSCRNIDDGTLTNNVRDALAKTLSARVMERIQITAKNRVVTLSGAVNFLGTRALAGRLARKVECVRIVINKIKFVRGAEACTGGTQECCCPEDGCVCSRICPPCGTQKPPHPGNRRGRRR